MPKHKPTPQQPTFFRREIPQMPEGYYSSGPNPNLAAFVQQHATPYDPETDDYDVPPFDQPITTTKATAIYNMHTYWSKKPHDAIQQYIRHYTKPGDLVLDPFCGSGGTALAALMEGRAAVAIDLSPAATFITKNYCTPVDVEELQRAFEELERRVKPEMDWLYETRCDRCDGRATTAYTVYSNVFQCPKCLEKFPLFDCPEVSGQTAKGKPKKIRACPYCYQTGHIEPIRSQSTKFGHVPVLVSYLCEEGCTPQRGERRHNDPDEKKRAYFQRYDLSKIREIEAQEIPYWYPKGFDMRGFDRYQRDALYYYGVSEVADLFTKRNLWALAIIKKHVCEFDIFSRDLMDLAITATVLPLSRMQRNSDDPRFPNRILMGTYYLPQISKEFNVINWYLGKLKTLIPGKNYINQTLQSEELVISTQSSTSLPIGDNSIDYIFTDPPYSGTVQYGELNFVWEAWLNLDTNWHNQEIIINETRGRSEDDWANMMRVAMTECWRVLKPGRWISLCYHDTSEGTWQLVQDIMAEAGFVSIQSSTNTIYIDAEQKSFNQLTADKVTKRDLVINFRKPRPGELAAALLLTGEEDATTFRQKAGAILIEALSAHPGQTADRLYDLLVSRMVRKGQFERHNFEELLASIAEPVSPSPLPFRGGAGGEVRGEVRWYLKATADALDDLESRRESSAAARLEAFMLQTLAEHPAQEGVHYSDLFEQYLPLPDKPRRLLQEWLPEFFFKTPQGTWRPPRDEEERRQKAELRSSGSLRRIKRFANALLDGVPPHPRDLPESAAALADWLYQCRRAGLYDLGRALYEKGGFSFDSLGEELRLQVEEDYQICVRRSEAAKPKAKKVGQEELELAESE